MTDIDFSAVKAQLSDASRKLADLTASMVYENPGLLKSFIDLAWRDEEPWSHRSSRVVSICCCNFPKMLEPFASEVIKNLVVKKSEGSRRNFLKIFSSADVRLKPRDRLLLMNSCFDFLSGNYSIAVKVYSMDILLKLSGTIPEIRKELYLVITDQWDDSSIGFKSHARKILKKLEKNC